MKVAILVIALFALTAFAQDEQEYFGLPSRQQIGNGFKTAGNIAGKVSGPLSTAGGVINRLPPVQVGPVNTRVVGADLAGAGVATGIASKGFNYVGNKLGGREVEEEFEFIDESVEYIDVEAVEDFNLPNRQQVANGFHKAGNIAGTVSNVAGKVSNYAGKASSGLHWVGNKIGGREVEEEQEYFGLPSRQQIGNGFKTAGNIAGRVSGPLKVTGGVINRLPPVQVGPVNSRVVGAGVSAAGKVAGVASHGFNYIGNKLGGREVEEEYLY